MSEDIKLLLEKNNALLQELVDSQKKQSRSQRRRWLLQTLIQILPFILLFILGWYVFGIVTDSIQAVQGNVDSAKDGFNQLIDDVTFWD